MAVVDSMKLIAKPDVPNIVKGMAIGLYKKYIGYPTFNKRVFVYLGYRIIIMVPQKRIIIRALYAARLWYKGSYRYSALTNKIQLNELGINSGTGDPVELVGPFPAIAQTLNVVTESRALINSNQYLYDAGTAPWLLNALRKGLKPQTFFLEGVVKVSPDSTFINDTPASKFEPYLPVQTTDAYMYVGTDKNGDEVVFIPVDNTYQCNETGAQDVVRDDTANVLSNWFVTPGARANTPLRTFLTEYKHYAAVPLQNILDTVTTTYNIPNKHDVRFLFDPVFKENFSIGAAPEDTATFEVPIMALDEQPYEYTISNQLIKDQLTDPSSTEVWSVEIPASSFTPPSSFRGPPGPATIRVYGDAYNIDDNDRLTISGATIYIAFNVPGLRTLISYNDDVLTVTSTGRGLEARYLGEARICSIAEFMDADPTLYGTQYTQDITWDSVPVWQRISNNNHQYGFHWEYANCAASLKSDVIADNEIRNEGERRFREWKIRATSTGFKIAEGVGTQLDSSTLSGTNPHIIFSVVGSISQSYNVAKNITYVNGEFITEIQDPPVESALNLNDVSQSTFNVSYTYQQGLHTVTANDVYEIRFDGRSAPYGGRLRQNNVMNFYNYDSIYPVFEYGAQHQPTVPWQHKLKLSEFPALPPNDPFPGLGGDLYTTYDQYITMYNAYAVMVDGQYHTVHEYALYQYEYSNKPPPFSTKTVANRKLFLHTYIDGEALGTPFEVDPGTFGIVSTPGRDRTQEPDTVKWNTFTETFTTTIDQNNSNGGYSRIGDKVCYMHGGYDTRETQLLGGYYKLQEIPDYWVRTSGEFLNYPRGGSSFSADPLTKSSSFPYNLDSGMYGDGQWLNVKWTRRYDDQTEPRTTNFITAAAPSADRLGYYGGTEFQSTIHWVRGNSTDGLCIVRYSYPYEFGSSNEITRLKAEYGALVAAGASDEELEVVGAQIDARTTVILNNFASTHLIRLLPPLRFLHYTQD